VFISVYQEVKCDYSYNMQKFLFHQLVSSKLISKAQLNMFALRFHLSHSGTTEAQMEVFSNSGVVRTVSYSDGSKNFERVGAEDNLSVPSSFIANLHKGLYVFYTDKGSFLKKNLSPPLCIRHCMVS